MKKCPFCAEEIRDEAIKCKHCGEMLDEKPQEIDSSEHLAMAKQLAVAGQRWSQGRIVGSIAAAAGLSLIFISLATDVTVAVPGGPNDFAPSGRVNNIGLMHRQQLLLITGFGGLVSGLLVALLSPNGNAGTADGLGAGVLRGFRKLFSPVRAASPERIKILFCVAVGTICFSGAAVSSSLLGLGWIPSLLLSLLVTVSGAAWGYQNGQGLSSRSYTLSDSALLNALCLMVAGLLAGFLLVKGEVDNSNRLKFEYIARLRRFVSASQKYVDMAASEAKDTMTSSELSLALDGLRAREELDRLKREGEF